MIQERIQRFCINIIQPFEERFGLHIQPSFAFALFQQLGRQHRRKGQSHERRNRHRTGDYDTELLKQTPCHPFHKDNRKEHGHQCHRRRHNGKEDLLRTLYARLLRLHPLLDTDIDILRHHDRIVHHQSDRKHHSQHRQHIDGEAGDIHHEERPHQRNRDYHHRDHRHTPVAQEQEDDQHHEQESHINSLFHLLDRGTDKAGVIVDHFDRNILRQVFLQLLDTLVRLVGNLDLVSTRLRDDDIDNHRLAILTHHASQILRTDLGAPDVLKTDDVIAIPFDNQIIKFRCRMHQPKRTDRQIDRITFYAAGRKLYVFRIYRVLHIQRGDTVAGHFDRVQPQAHGVTLLSPDIHATHVRNGLKPLFHRQFGNLTQFHQRPLTASDTDLHDRGCIGICFRNRRRVTVAGQVTLGA